MKYQSVGAFLDTIISLVWFAFLFVEYKPGATVVNEVQLPSSPERKGEKKTMSKTPATAKSPVTKHAIKLPSKQKGETVAKTSAELAATIEETGKFSLADLNVLTPMVENDISLANADAKTWAWTIVKYAAADATSVLSRRALGEIYVKFLALSIASQKAFAEKWAKALGVPVPEYPEMTSRGGGRTTGRAALVQLVYAKRPQMLEIKPGERDSKGGKSVTAAMRVYLTETGQRKERDKAKAALGRMRLGVVNLFSACETDEEAELLLTIVRRLNIPDDTLEDWIKDANKVRTEAPEAAEVTA
jgi:hypothetical protein